MDVFLIPLGGDRYELYCEAPDDDAEQSAHPPKQGLIARLKYRFGQVYAAAERHRNRPALEVDDGPTTFFGRMKGRALAWIADAIAEQRLLWHLRHQSAVTLHFPDDMAEAEAMRIARAALQRDADRHRWWLAIDGVLMIISGLLILVPGPNVVGYYFAFRVVGHYFSWRGARQGLDVVQWQTAASEPLAHVRDAIRMDHTQRERTLLDVASRLRLDHLATFVERVAFDPRTSGAQAGG